RAGEALLVHAIDDGQPLLVIRRQAGLPQQPASAEGAAGRMGIQANAVLADPGEQAIVLGQGLDRGVRDGGAGPEQDHAELVDGDVAVPVLVAIDQTRGRLVERAHLQVEVTPPVAEARQFMKRAHGRLRAEWTGWSRSLLGCPSW